MLYEIPSDSVTAKPITYDVTAAGCWVCTSHKRFKNGYFALCRNGKPGYMHRHIWEAANKRAIPRGLYVCHTCDNASCINPEHLFIGTQQDNMTDKVNKNKQLKGERIRNSKLKIKDIAAIRTRLRNGDTQISVADAFGVDRITINDIVNGRSWVGVGV
jgi:hypothetical protein